MKYTLEYLDSDLDAYYHASARVYYGGTPTPEYQYSIQDHLGNTRIMFADKDNDGIIEETAGEILQEHHYYPFGLEINGPWNSYGLEDSRYRYNGKEFSEELGLYDYGARWYDPAIGRWNAVDPLAEKYSSTTPYAYVKNMPLIAIDPDGADIIIVNNANFGQVLKDLAVIGSTKRGRQVINRLAKSNRTYTINGGATPHKYGAWLTHGTRYNNFTNNLTYSQEDGVMIDGVRTKSHYTLGHELYHAYQDETDSNLGSIGREIEAVRFENYMRDVFGSGERRSKYGKASIPGYLALTKGNEKRVDLNSVEVFTIRSFGTDQSSPEGEGGTMPRDNVNNGVSIPTMVNHVLKYMNETGVQQVRLNFR